MMRLKYGQKNRKRAEKRHLCAFTLLELMIVVTIIGILSSISFPVLQTALLRARIAQTQTNLSQISKAIELYASDHGNYPIGSNDPPTSFITNYDAQLALKSLLGVYLPDSPSLFIDPFTKNIASQINESIAFESAIPEFFGFGYYDYSHFMVPPRKPIRGYGIISFGPDGLDSGLGLKPLSGIGQYLPGACYHPSNGLSSQGDLGAFGGQIGFPSRIPN